MAKRFYLIDGELLWKGAGPRECPRCDCDGPPDPPDPVLACINPAIAGSIANVTSWFIDVAGLWLQWPGNCSTGSMCTKESVAARLANINATFPGVHELLPCPASYLAPYSLPPSYLTWGWFGEPAGPCIPSPSIIMYAGCFSRESAPGGYRGGFEVRIILRTVSDGHPGGAGSTSGVGNDGLVAGWEVYSADGAPAVPGGGACCLGVTVPNQFPDTARQPWKPLIGTPNPLGHTYRSWAELVPGTTTCQVDYYSPDNNSIGFGSGAIGEYDGSPIYLWKAS